MRTLTLTLTRTRTLTLTLTLTRTLTLSRSRLIREGDDPDYAADLWKPRNLEFFHFIFVSKLPTLPEWCTDKFFILKVAGG